MKVKKTVIEWLSWLKLEDKKLSSKREQLKNKAFSVAMAYQQNDFKEAEAESLFKSIEVMSENILIVRNALSVYNAKTTIKIGDREISIATALHLWKIRKDDNLELIENLYKKFLNEKKKMEELSDKKIHEIERELLSKQNATKTDRENVEKKKTDFAVKILDPLKIEELYLKKQEEYEEFIEKVNVNINLKNSTTELEVELKD